MELFKPRVIDNDKGYGFAFEAGAELTYYLLFNRIQNIFKKRASLSLTESFSCYLLEFDYQGKVVKQLSGGPIRETICHLIEQFLLDHPEAVIFNIYDDTKVSEKVRHRLLSRWFDRYNKQGLFSKVDILTGAEQTDIVSIIFKADNTHFLAHLR